MCPLTYQRLEVLNMIFWTKMFFNANFKKIYIYIYIIYIYVYIYILYIYIYKLNDTLFNIFQTLLEVKSL